VFLLKCTHEVDDHLIRLLFVEIGPTGILAIFRPNHHNPASDGTARLLPASHACAKSARNPVRGLFGQAGLIQECRNDGLRAIEAILKNADGHFGLFHLELLSYPSPERLSHPRTNVMTHWLA
jgi:hypothetical protein